VNDANKLIGIQVALSRRRGRWQMAEGTRIKSFSFFAKVCNLNVSLFHHSRGRLIGESVANSWLGYVWGERTCIDNKIC